MATAIQSHVMLRWAAFLPAAFIAALIAYWAMKFAQNLFSGMQGVDTGSFLFRVFVEFMASGAMGAAFVYAGAWVAPSHKKHVSYALAGLGLVLSGVLLFPALLVSDYWAVWGVVALIAGIGAITFGIHTGDIAFEP